ATASTTRSHSCAEVSTRAPSGSTSRFGAFVQSWVGTPGKVHLDLGHAVSPTPTRSAGRPTRRHPCRPRVAYARPRAGRGQAATGSTTPVVGAGLGMYGSQVTASAPATFMPNQPFFALLSAG